MFLIWILTFFYVFTTKNFLGLYPTLIAFWLQFFITVFFGTKYAPFSIIGRNLIKKQKPEYVWAIQKRFAWFLWLIMATIMFVVTLWFWLKWIVPFSICSICLALMWMESSLGICVWCKIYAYLINKKIIKTKQVQRCPGGACSIKS